MSYLLIIEYFDRHGASEGTNQLLMPDFNTGVAFAKQLVTDYFNCPALYHQGEFKDQSVHGDWYTDEETFCVNWTVLSTKEEYIITVSPIARYSEGMRLDFWNE